MIHDILNEREALYGDFTTLAPMAQFLKRMFRTAPSSSKLSDIQAEALDGIAVKLARILNGDPTVADNWQDIAGNASLAHEELVMAAQPKAEPVKAPVTTAPTPPIPFAKIDQAAKEVLNTLGENDPLPTFLTNGDKKGKGL